LFSAELEAMQHPQIYAEHNQFSVQNTSGKLYCSYWYK